MARNLDITALRSFVAVAETGGVTRAASHLNLTQSAVSMQIKRLEEALGQQLLDRTGRSISLSAHGEKLLGQGRRMLELNDEIWAQMRDVQFEGEIRFGVPHDIIYPYVPRILQRFAAEYPRVRLQLVSCYTRRLKEDLKNGVIDLILTTENGLEDGGETLLTQELKWVGAPGGIAWKNRPLKLAFENQCIFRTPVQRALDDANIPWEMAIASDSTRTIDATVSADLAVHANLAGNSVPHLEIIDHGGALPRLGSVNVNMYCAVGPVQLLANALATFVRAAYAPDMVRAAE